MGHYLREMEDRTKQDRLLDLWISCKKRIKSLPSCLFTVGELDFIFQMLHEPDRWNNSQDMQKFKELSQRKAEK